jgi:hypothetical protein
MHLGSIKKILSTLSKQTLQYIPVIVPLLNVFSLEIEVIEEPLLLSITHRNV